MNGPAAAPLRTPVAAQHLPPPRPGLRCVVVIPAKDEAALLPAALQALALQCYRGFEIVVLANNCGDDTAAVARGFAQHQGRLVLHVLEARFEGGEANVGHARRVLMDLAADRLARAGAADGWIASTDADTRVAPDWLERNAEAIAAGADAVGGRIRTERAPMHDPRAPRLARLDAYARLLRLRIECHLDPQSWDPWPRHHQHFGASLAVRADAYRHVGGLPDQPHLEDEALVQALRRADLRVRHSPRVRVTTSARHDGRAEIGLAWQLRTWAVAADDDPRVDDAATVAAEARARRALRALWRTVSGDPGGRGPCAALDRLAAQIDLDPARLAACLARREPFGATWDAVGAMAALPRRQLPLRLAIADLRGWWQRAARGA